MTPQFTKVVERVVGGVFVPWLAENGYGEHEYPYSHGNSHRGVLVVNVCSWFVALEDCLAVAFLCSGVSCASDRVCKDRFGAKHRESGLSAIMISFLEFWVEDHVASVVVAGVKSDDQVLANFVFHGIVFGPPLWHYFCAYARFSVRDQGFIELVFADFFNFWKTFEQRRIGGPICIYIIGVLTQLAPVWKS